MEAEPIAVVGVGCTLPGGVRTLEAARAVFEGGRTCVRELPSGRGEVDARHDPDPRAPGRTSVRYGGVVDDIDRFDAAFFDVSDAEAVRMDPQHRMLLQTVWHALENAGQDPEELSGGTTGVFVALASHDYALLRSRGGPAAVGAHEAGNTAGMAAGRIAHFLGLRGPCLTVDTACSGSLVALHLARQSLLTGECDTAIVAGANAVLVPDAHPSPAGSGRSSRAGDCRTADTDADTDADGYVCSDGYVRSDGCVAVLLKRQSLAEEQGDPILAGVVGTALNHSGGARGLATPDGSGQQRVIRAALASAGVQPRQVDYVEAHGAGTPVGDPVEMDAILRTYGAGRPTDQPLYVSSGQGNLGHIEAGAGLLGVVRAALSLDRETIYPSLHLDRPHPGIDLAGTPVRIPGAPVRWPRRDSPRLAAVNSFGHSGTNAHALLREAPRRDPADPPPPAAAPARADELLVLSAKSADSLHDLAGRWADFLTRPDGPGLPAAVFTAAAGRAALRHRIAVTGRGATRLADGLREWRAGRAPAGVTAGHPRGTAEVALVFSGEGTQYPAMARELYAQEPVFTDAVDRCAAVVDGLLDVPLREVLFGRVPTGPGGSARGDGGPARDAADIDDTRFAGPALFAVGYGIAELLRSWGVRPAAVTGHGVGELVAACVGGMLAPEEAARFSVGRARVLAALPPGGRMLAVGADVRTVAGWLAGHEGRAAVAAVNGPRGVVVSGAADAVREIAGRAAAAGADTAWLRTSHAHHSPLMDPALPELRALAAELRPRRPDSRVFSGTTARPLTGEEGPGYWAAQARELVRRHDAVRAAVDAGCTLVVEVGPHAAPTGHVAEAFADRGVTALTTLDRDGQDVRRLLGVAGALFTAGAELALPRVYRGDRYRRTSAAPLYPFRKDRYWWGDSSAPTGSASSTATAPARPAPPPPRAATAAAAPPAAGVTAPAPTVPAPAAAPTAEAHARQPGPSVHDHRLAVEPPWSDHRVHGATVFPGTGHLDLVVRALAEAAREAAATGGAGAGAGATEGAEAVTGNGNGAGTHAPDDADGGGSTEATGSTGATDLGAAHGDGSSDGERTSLVLTDVRFLRPLVLTAAGPTTARVTLSAPGPGGVRRFTVTSGAPGGSWPEHCHGTVAPAPGTEPTGRTERAEPAGWTVPTQRTGPAEPTRRTGPTEQTDPTDPTGRTGRTESAGRTGQDEPSGPVPDVLRARAPHALRTARLYGALRAGGLEHGTHFATVRELWRARSGRAEALGRITPAPDGAPAEPHPYRLATVLDGALQLAAAFFLRPEEPDDAGAECAGAEGRRADPASGSGTEEGGEEADRAAAGGIAADTPTLLPGGYVPVALRRLALSGPLPGQVWAQVRRRPHATRTGFTVDLRLTDDAGRVVADLEGVEFRHAGALAGRASADRARHAAGEVAGTPGGPTL
ncbi:putative polyketide synthase [Actinacidiphila reveromycinica]|uniref:Putative polyketide synthase n=1 Tax=Actinacidiphila reveromycinica TaxID=659352 RepID=A0A7U3UR31_9ACTN|nr:type I polyketide synthase [Streptomyces sp. SN-593]BBA97086.1 putative polyketide synthase [Streptomyces sp. SN-593]